VDLKKFYPTSTLVTGYDIIFFWVARMIMAGLEFTGEVPFKDIYITGLVRDKQGRKMSKSLGNGLDPLEIVDEYGADALKFTMIFMSAQGQDILIDKESFKLGSKFANKIWNASRYIMMNLEGRTLVPIEDIELKSADKWIFHRFNEAVRKTRAAIESYRFNDAAQAGYEFFWNEFCDWYVEASKISLYSDDENEKNRAVSLLIHVLGESLKLLHPFLSFITEEIYQNLPGADGFLMKKSFPEVSEARDFPEEASLFESLQEMIRGVRTLRSEFTIPPEKRVTVKVLTDSGFAGHEFFQDNRSLASELMKSPDLEILKDKPDTEGSVPVAGKVYEAYVYIRDVVDIPKEIAKLKKEADKQDKLIISTTKKLSNSGFLDRAPAEVIEKEKEKLAEFEDRSEKVKRYLKDLQA